MDYHQDRFVDYSLMIYKEEQLIAVLPANRVGNVVYSHQGLTYGGLLFFETLKFRDVLSVFKSVLQHMYDDGVELLQLKQLPSFYAKIPNDELLYLMFICDAKLIRRDALSVIHLEQRPKVSKNRIEGYKRGKKHGLVIKEEDTFDAFWTTILLPNLQKKHQAKPVHTLEEITLLKTRFPKRIRQFNVYKNNDIVAGTTIFETRCVAHSQYISGNDDKNSLGSLDFLHMYLIEDVFKEKTYFDFGTSNENQGQQVNAGLQYWKEGFGARTKTQDFYELKTNNYKMLETVML
ncbi:GNAT family N-acetyltransferase [Psychroserpens sp. MEBiC05023]